MRAFASTFVARILIGVLIVGLSVWGISNVFVNLASTTVGRVGDQEISSREFQRAYISQVNAYAQQTGVVPTTEEARNLGIPAAVIQQLAASAALDGLAEGSGMGASETLIARKVAEDPNFSGAIGGFDAERFNSLLRQNGWTEAEYLGEQAGAVRREQLAQSLFIGLPPPQAMQHLVRRY
ncbi:MAG: SurA N-terminal domain-containing protein, partial [Cucumibacter sp.]